MNNHRWTAGIAGALLAAHCAAPSASAAITMADIQYWIGPTAGPGIKQAAVVIDWRDGQAPLVWGYRWDGSQRETGEEMLAAVVGADPRLTITNLGFVEGLGFDSDLNGTADRFKPGFNGATGEFWNYYVNNDVFFHPTDFTQNSHIVPPNTVVVPNGDPFAAASPGHWVSSSTGAGGRELADGSWDGFIYTIFDGPTPAEPIAVSPIPEPACLALVGVAALLGLRRRKAVTVLCLAGAATVQAGPFAPAAGSPDSTAIPANSPQFVAWATEVSQVARGRQKVDDPSLGLATYGNTDEDENPVLPDYYVKGASDATPNDPYNVFSLGDGGSMTLTFDQPVVNGAGPDFAVFENGFSFSQSTFFMELAFVEVSSNGSDFVRFPAVSLTQTSTQVGTFASIDPTDVHNLAGKYQAGYGTPFDLDEIRNWSKLLNVNRINYVRVVDVIGNINPAYARQDSQGHIINDPWPTPYDSSGFDLDAVGVIHQANSPFQLWRSRNFSSVELAQSSISGADADPDGDGVNNLFEYATDLNPHASSSPQLMSVAPDNGILMRFKRRHDNFDVIYTLQKSIDGQPWTDVARSVRGEPMTVLFGNPGVTLDESITVPTVVSVTAPVAPGSAQFRLQVALAP